MTGFPILIGEENPVSELPPGISRGPLIVQSGHFQSMDFSTGVSGWIIRANGDTEFNDGVFRGTITATAGAIGGFTLGTDYIRDAADSFGVASTVTGGDDVRFWAGDTFANRATAPLRITEAGSMWLGGDLILSAPAGQIGIGITPGVPFHVASALYGDSSYFDLYDNVGTGVFLSVRKSRHDTIGSHTIVQDGDDLGGIKGFGSDGSAFRQAGRIAFAVDGTPGASDMPGRIVFFTTPDGSLAPTERLRIDSTGKLIIGADLDTYAYLQAADSWGFVAGGVEMLRLTESTNDQVFIGPAGSNTVPALSLITDADTGLAWSAADTLAVIVGGIEKGLFKTTGFEPGSGSFVAGGGQIYTDATNGLFVVGQTGTSFDLIVAEGSGGTLFSNAAGTTVINFASTPTVGGTAVSLVGHTH